MEEKEKNVNDAFMEAVRSKMEKQDKKIEVIEECLNGLPQITKQLGSITGLLKQQNLPRHDPQIQGETAAELLNALQNTNDILRQPRKQSVQHHHYFPKFLWITVAVLLVSVLAISELYMTYKKLDIYEANDIKYRFLKLDTATIPLQVRLHSVDSIYNRHPEFKRRVIELEEERKFKLEQLSKSSFLRKQADDLERSARQKKPAKLESTSPKK